MSKIFSLVSTMAIAVAVGVILMLCADLLPDSPFQQFISASALGNLSQYFKFVFYFIPVAKMIAVMEAWILVMTNWYTFIIVYRVANSVVSTLSSPMNTMLKK